jgi:hypothetical protein
MSDSKNPKIVLDTPCARVDAPREASRGGRQAPGLILEAAGSGTPTPRQPLARFANRQLHS